MTKTHIPWLAIACGLLFITLGGSGAYGYWRITTLNDRVALLEGTLASTTALLIGTIEETEISLSSALSREKEDLEDRLGSISGTVNTLEKLSKTDPELLQKYSKVYFLNEHYVPERLSEIADQYEYTEAEHNLFLSAAYPYLRKLLDNAEEDGVQIFVSSAYRSFDEQHALKGQYTTTFGAGTANSFSADQGYSEHQLGTTVDLTTTGIGGGLTIAFDKTAAFTWLKNNAHRYGFVLSYPPNNKYYVYEPWHWRFVGEDLARDLHEDNKYFYDLDQREIDKYLVSLFD